MTSTDSLEAPPKVSGGDAPDGHLQELRDDPIGLMWRVRHECGDVGEFRLGDRDVVLLTGADANEVFFRATDDELDQGEAYPFMTPVFGEGIVFDASPERRREMLHNQSLRDRYMRGHAETIAAEVARMVAGWGDDGEIDLLDFFAELTIYTSSSCLIGRKFRESLTPQCAELFGDLEQGTDALAFVDPYADIESFHRRDQARAELVELIAAILDERRGAPPPPADERDLVDVLVSIADDDGNPLFSADQVTGMFISMMFAGHHTTSGTAAWTLIELLRHPEWFARVVAEHDAMAAEGAEVTYQALREMPVTEAAIKEALRLHPPLILLLRVAKVPVDVGGYRIEPGKLVGASLSVSNQLPEAFDAPDDYDPGRYLAPRQDDVDNPWNWIPFGAGRHRCVGAAFAMMQLKSIFSVLLRDWTFEAAQPFDSYRNDHSKMVVQLAQPCRARYRRRGADGETSAEPLDASAAVASADAPERWRIVVDRDLCQGHGVCASEAPEVFEVSRKGDLTVRDERPGDARRAAVELAVRYCPTHALSIEEDE
ncbi:MAG: cytochrome P450 [Acidimicrobiia bacterium]|nr:cytochrome P450 [Acidimicrobiia bacterium]